MNPQVTCSNLHGLLSTERAAIHFHLDSQAAAGCLADRREAVRVFIEGYGGIMRNIYCAHVCPDRARCAVVVQPTVLSGGLAQKPAV